MSKNSLSRELIKAFRHWKSETFKRYPFITVWFVPYRNWHNLGAYRNKRNWYCRAWTGGNILGTKTYGVGLLGLQIMTGLKSVKE